MQVGASWMGLLLNIRPSGPAGLFTFGAFPVDFVHRVLRSSSRHRVGIGGFKQSSGWTLNLYLKFYTSHVTNGMH